MAARSSTKKKKKALPRQSRDPVVTKRALTDAGEKLFAKYGFDGATVDMIVAEAGVNRALVSYYFESKEGLYDAVITAIVSDVVSDVATAVDENENAEKNLRAYIRSLARAFAARPSFAAILMREYIGGAMQERETPFAQVIQFFRMTERIYLAGRKEKLFRKLDPHKLHLSIVAPLVHFTLTIDFRARTFDRFASDIENPGVEAFSSHHEDLILAGLRQNG